MSSSLFALKFCLGFAALSISDVFLSLFNSPAHHVEGFWCTSGTEKLLGPFVMWKQPALVVCCRLTSKSDSQPA